MGESTCRQRTSVNRPLLTDRPTAGWGRAAKPPMGRAARPLLALPRVAKRLLAIATDSCLCLLTTWLALSLRLEEWVTFTATHWLIAGASVALALPIFVSTGLYRAIFRYAGFSAFKAVIAAMAMYATIYAVIVGVVGVAGVPRSIGVLQPLLLLLAVGASRAVASYWLSGLYRAILNRQSMPRALIYGAGSAGRQLAAAIGSARDIVAVGFIDDDPLLHGQTLNGLPIFMPASLADVTERHHVTDVLLAVPSATRARRNAILASLQGYGLRVGTLPGLMDLAQGRVQIADVRELDLEDLLGRDRVLPNDLLLNRHVRGLTVMVTGAGGSIGSELCRQIVGLGPACLLLVDHSEYALYRVHRDLRERLANAGGAEVRVLPLLASVRDEDRMGEIMSTWRPATVYHAAAYKHVPMVEHNPAEGIKNNVWGTMTTACCALANDVANFVLVSTDKAVRPTNVMGASKRLAEMVLQALAKQGSSTCFSMVRFGNVLGSSGSVVPLFRQQIRDGGPITLTHQDVTRYFMTIPEAAQLVIQAGAMAAGGDVFVLDMGKPIKIIELARRMVELSGLTIRDADRPDGDIAIEITGMRPGEKLYEELLLGENPLPTQHPLIMKAHEEFLPWPVLKRELDRLSVLLERNDVPAIRSLLELLVSGYRPHGEVVDWVHMESVMQSSHPVALEESGLTMQVEFLRA